MREIYNLYDKPKNPLNYVAVRISLARRRKSVVGHMEVKARDHNYRTFKPELTVSSAQEFSVQ